MELAFWDISIYIFFLLQNGSQVLIGPDKMSKYMGQDKMAEPAN